MSRLYPYILHPSGSVQQRIEETFETTMYLMQTTGPTSFVVKETNSQVKHKVCIGATNTCSCSEREICRHHLFVMLKVKNTQYILILRSSMYVGPSTIAYQPPRVANITR